METGGNPKNVEKLLKIIRGRSIQRVIPQTVLRQYEFNPVLQRYTDQAKDIKEARLERQNSIDLIASSTVILSKIKLFLR
jgi:hypothetical protein